MSASAALLSLVLQATAPLAGTSPGAQVAVAPDGPSAAAGVAAAEPGVAETVTASTEHPDYPLRGGATPDFWTPGDPFRLTDLHFGLLDDRGTTQSFGARMKVSQLGLVGVSFEGERRSVSLLTRRTELRFGVDDGRIAAAASFRARRFILSLDLVENEADGQEGYVFRPALAARLTPGLELLGGIETDSRQVGGETLRASSGGLLWQRGAGFEATGLFTHERIPTAAPDSDGTLAVNRVNTASFATVGQVGVVAELQASGFLRDIEGRFPRTEVGGTLGTRLAITRRLRIEGSALAQFEDGPGLQSHVYRGGFTWFARKQTLPEPGTQHAARRSSLGMRRGPVSTSVGLTSMANAGSRDSAWR